MRASLEQERSDLRARLAEMGLLSGGELSFDQNFADSSQVTAERGEVEALAGNLRESLNDVEAAIVKLDNGTFGVCESCGQPIPPARLEAKPAARLCMDCASRR
ncbi:MAG TPA: TraR/DksA C4-type zinc finger protein [Acidimicrobiales bacterium]|nr:TraR/DksA C4-type zinc finger protein [Acidimicrobiales bacterium]